MAGSAFVAKDRWRERLGVAEASQEDPEPEGARKHLRLHGILVFVRDQDRSLEFYVNRLGFDLLVDHVVSPDFRWIAVAPPDGSACLVLIRPSAESQDHARIGGHTGVFLLTDDVNAKYREWSERGVRFRHAPVSFEQWGGRHVTFEDIDGNCFHLIEADVVTAQIEAERRAAENRRQAELRAIQEMEIATQVQARLFPQRFPALETLEYGGLCIQARQVGGDYYDFLDFGQRRLGLVVGDVAGKGIAAALLMANLQANLRSQYLMGLDDLPSLLTSVNRVFYENSAEASYATLFFGAYDDASRRLRYVNCGHLAPLLLRGGGTMERLAPTCSVLGMFGSLPCAAAEVRLYSGDLILLYTDGVTESTDERGFEFGEERLTNLLRANAHLHARELLQAIVEAVQSFGGQQDDDVTLLAARCTG